MTDKSAAVAKEIRFSVVMYGGSSLAIYMNGVTQELLHMVRSTARDCWESGPETKFRFKDENDPTDDGRPVLKSTETYYRELARMLNTLNDDQDQLNDVRFVPNGLYGHFFRKFFAMAFWLEIVMVIGGTIFSPPVQSVGLKLLALTTILWLVKDACARYMLRGRKGLRAECEEMEV